MLGLVVLAVVTIATVNIEALAQDKGWDVWLTNNWDPVVSEVERVIDSALFWASFWFISGATAGTWLTYFLYRDKGAENKLEELQIDRSKNDSAGNLMPSDSWRSVDELTLWQIANLWVRQEPEAIIPSGDPAYPILRMLKTDVTNYKLHAAEDIAGKQIIIHAKGDRKSDVDMNTLIMRSTLLAYIDNHKDKPKWDFGFGDSESMSAAKKEEVTENRYPERINKIVDHVALRIDDSNSGNCYLATRHALRKVARDGRITFSGKKKKSRDRNPSRLSTPISAEFWNDQELTQYATEDQYRHFIHTERELDSDNRPIGEYRGQYWEVTGIMDEIKEVWP